MKCLTLTEVQEWLKPSGIIVSEDRSFRVPSRGKTAPFAFLPGIRGKSNRRG